MGETRELSARLALAWRPSATLALTLAADANDGDNGLNPYTTLIDEVSGGAVYAAGYRNTYVALAPYDSNTGQADQTRTTNAARGLSITAAWDVTDRLTARTIGSIRRSEYTAGLDDDGLFDDFLSFPEDGQAGQVSVEAHLLGDFDAVEFVGGVYHFSEDGSNIQDPTVFLGFKGAFQLTQTLDSTALFANASRVIANRWRLGGGMRTTRDTKRARTDVGIGIKGQPRDRLEPSAAVFHTQYDDLPYQVSTTQGEGFTTVNLIVGQRTTGLELDSTLYRTSRFRLQFALGHLEVDVDRQRRVQARGAVDAETHAVVKPEYRWLLASGAESSPASTTPTGGPCGESRVPIPPGSPESAAAASSTSTSDSEPLTAPGPRRSTVATPATSVTTMRASTPATICCGFSATTQASSGCDSKAGSNCVAPSGLKCSAARCGPGGPRTRETARNTAHGVRRHAGNRRVL